MPSTEQLPAPCGIPPRLRHCSKPKWIGEWPEVPSDSDMVLIAGPTGTGKSHLAIALAVEWMQERGIPSGTGHRWIRREGQAGEFRESYNGAQWRDIQQSVELMKPDGSPEELDFVLGCQLLVYDDLGAERLTDFTLDRVSFVLRHRYNWMLQTIVTTNLSPSAIAEIDPRLASRLCSGIVIKREGKDRRL